MDAAVQKLMNQSYAEAKQLLEGNRALLDEIALYLLDKETITGDELMSFVNADKEPKQETVAESETTEE